MSNIKLSENFYLSEFMISDYAERNGIDNTPPEELIKNGRALCNNVLQELRDYLLRPIIVTSGYRSHELNKAIGGSDRSQHMEFKAADITVPGFEVQDIIKLVKMLHLNFDQCINEFDRWVHISYNEGNNRNQFLKAYKKDGKTVYEKMEVNA